MDSPASKVSSETGCSGGRSQAHHKKRVRVWTEDDRAKHRVFEKGRREAFSDSLLTLARFLPSLTSVKESKLSKHTIVDESLKYHKEQKVKLEDLQKAVDALKVEKEALVAELAGWQECLDTTSAHAAPVKLLEGKDVEGSVSGTSSSDLTRAHDTTAIPGYVTTHEVPVMVPAAYYNMPANAFPNDMPDMQLLDKYTLQTSGFLLADDLCSNVQPRTSQYNLSQGDIHGQYHQHSLWSAQQSSRIQQPLWTQSSYQELPLDFQQHRSPGQGYDLHIG